MTRLATLFLSFLVFLLIFVAFFHRITAFTQDLGRHIALGNIILTTHSIPSTNLFSYTYPDFPFLNHHWFSEVLFSIIFSLTGSTGLLLLTTLLALLAFGLLFLYSYKKTPVGSIIASLLLLPILFERTDIRPEIFSFLLFSIFLLVLYRYRVKQTKLIYVLPVLMILWVNLHIYFFTGIVLLILFCIDALLISRRNPLCTYTKTLGAVLVLSSVATLLNPHFLIGALYPLGALKNYGYTIEENQTIFFLESLGFHKQSIDFFNLTAILLFLLLCINYKKARPIDWLLSVTFAIAGALAVRNLPLFAFGAFIPFSTNSAYILKRVAKITQSLSENKRRALMILGFAALFVAVFFETQSSVRKRPFGDYVDPGATNAADFFLAQHIHGPIFNNFDIGSYLDYRLYPKEKVFVDGRPEAYPSRFFTSTYIPMQENQGMFKKEDQHYRFNAIFFSHTDQTPWATTFLQSILKNPAWKPVYLDQTVIILLKDNAENASIIHRFAMEPKNLSPRYDRSDISSLLQLASFFSKLNDQDATYRFAQQILLLDPHSCQALYVRAAIALSRNDPLAQVYAQPYEQQCGNKQLGQ